MSAFGVAKRTSRVVLLAVSEKKSSKMNRLLGSHELNSYHINKSEGNLNITVGLLLRTDTPIDKGK